MNYRYKLTIFFILLFFVNGAFSAGRPDTTITRVLQSLEEEKPLEFQTKARPKTAGNKTDRPIPPGRLVEFTLKTIVLAGNTLFSNEELTPFYQKYINKKVTFYDLQQIADKITQKYRQAGYVLSYAILPKQEIEKGMILIKIVEGYINQYILEDPDKVFDSKIKSYLDQILLSKPLHQDVLEYYLLLVRRLFGVEIQTTFTSSPQKLNATDLIVSLKRRKITATVATNNDQTNNLGPWMGTAQVRVNNVTNSHDYIEATGVMSTDAKKFQAAFVKYELPVGDAGETVKLQANQSKSQPGGNLSLFQIKSNENAQKLVVRKPLVLERDEVLSVQAGGSFQNVKSTSPSGLGSYTDKTRSLILGMRYEVSDKFHGNNLIDSEVSYGLKGLDATSRIGSGRSTPYGMANYSRINFSADRLQQLDFFVTNLGILLSVQGQYAGNCLLAAQRFGIGGALNRAYLPGALTGDSGIQSKAELQYKIPFDSFIRDLTFYTFYSYSKIWNRSPSADQQYSTDAQGVGGGARASLGTKGSCYLAYGRPLTSSVAGVSVKDKVYAGIYYAI